MIQGTSTAEDYQSREVDSENPKQGQEKLISESQTQKLTEPLFFLKDLDEDIDRRLKAIQGQTEDQIKDGNNREKLETNSPDPHCNTDKKEEMTNVSNDSCQPDSHTSRPNKASNSSLKPSLKQASNSKIPKPVRSQRSNLGIIQQPASKVSHSCRTVPVADRKTTPTSNRRQRQSSVGPGGSSALLKHQINSSKRNDNESEKHISRMKPSQSSPIRKSADLDVILAAKKAGGETGSKLENEEPALEDFDNTEHKTPETRTEFLIWLSNAVSEKRLNPSQLDEYFSNYKSTFEYDTGKESQTEEFVYQEVLQKLIKKVSDLYEQFQAEKITNKKLHANFELTHSNDSNKIGLLEAENQEFIDKMKIYTKRFEEEKANNEKLKDKLKEAEKKSKSLEDKEKERVQKFKNLETNLKQKSNIEKELKEISTTCERLSHENSILKKELQKSEEEQHMKLVRMIEDSDEMRNMRSEILFLRGKLSEEANKGKRFLAEQQQTSYKLHETEMKCRDLSQLIEEAKKEMKAKSKEYEDFKRTVEDDKQMMRTELDACKVIKQGALDEIAMLRGKIENLQSKNEKVHNMEKETVEIEQQLRTDLALRDEQILQLQEQIKSLLLERKSGRDISKLKNKMSLEQCQAGAPERANMAAQIIDLQRHVDELANNNLELQKMLADRNAELEQRDHIVKLQTDVLKIRDELIGLLRSKDSTHEKHVEELSSILMEREHAIEKELKKNVESLQAAHLDASADRTKFQKFNASNATDLNRVSSDGARLSLKELHLMFQNKELDLDSMQARIKTLEKNHQNLSHQRIRQETRMRVLEESLQEKSSHTWIPMLVK